jgi:hypothetical protein
VARPALPITLSTSGKAAMMAFCRRMISEACWMETPGSVIGMKRRVPSSTGGMNSDPSRWKGTIVTASTATAMPMVSHRLRSAA